MTILNSLNIIMEIMKDDNFVIEKNKLFKI